MRKAWLIALGLVLGQIAGAQSAGSDSYIQSVEGLLNSVPSQDASRPQLTLKLADALFNETSKLSSQQPASPEQNRKADQYRRRAIGLYQDALAGLGGVFAVPTGVAKAKIQFQLARLLSDAGRVADAEKLWQELAAQTLNPDIEREALLRLAEASENQGQYLKAEEQFKKALTLCSTQDVCSYSHYRLAWVYYRAGRLDESVSEMNQALWDSKGQIREESLRDLVTFLASRPDDGKTSLMAMEALSQKLGRPTLINDLSDAYFAAGNKKAGILVLDAYNRQSPSIKSYAKLLEEDYGQRNWDKFNQELDASFNLVTTKEAAKALDDGETEKRLKRLTVQLDGERQTQPQRAEEFKKAVHLYLALFPEHAERAHMYDGWLAAEKDDNKKIQQLEQWIVRESAFHNTHPSAPFEEIRLREMRASLAQKTQDWPVVIAEMESLLKTANTQQSKVERTYQLAYAHSQAKDGAKALPLFQSLAVPPSGAQAPDKWAIQSQHLALDLLAQQKAYADIVKQARLWTLHPHFQDWLKGAGEHRGDLADLQKVETSAEFEWASAQGASSEALAVFNKDCMNDVLLPQSCENAQILAVKLKDQNTLLAVLRKTGKNAELAAELEASGRFVEAAQLLEGQSKDVDNKQYLKMALLYELGGNLKERDRVLKRLIATQSARKSLGAEEDLILQTLREANLFAPDLLKLSWKRENADHIRDWLEMHQRGTPQIRQELAQSCRQTGPGWLQVSVAELRKLDEQARKIHFAGKNSQTRFRMRVDAQKKLLDRGNCYLESSTASARVVMATLLARSEKAFAQEILSAPIPEGVDADTKTQLEAQLRQMAEPFQQSAEKFTTIASEQLAKVDGADEKAELTTRLAASDEMILLAPLSSRANKPLPAPNLDILNSALSELQKNVEGREPLEKLKSFYEQTGQGRLAAYYQGRLMQLGEGVKR